MVDISAWGGPIRPPEPTLLSPPALALDDERVGVLANLQPDRPVAGDLAVLQTPLGAIVNDEHAALQRIADPLNPPTERGEGGERGSGTRFVIFSCEGGHVIGAPAPY